MKTNERIVSDPSEHGWRELGNGKWGWAGELSGVAPVTSVNDKIGDVVLEATDVGALPDSTVIPPPTDLAGYATEAWVSTGYQVKGSYLVSSDLSGYATEAWVTNQGYSTYTGADAVKTTGNQTIGGIKTFSSDIRCKANVYAYYGSDERLKDEIAPMPVGLVDAIDPSTWKWKSDGSSSGGVIAQQLQEVGLDDWVREAPNGDLGVDYNALIGMLIAEVQDLKRRLADGNG